MEKQLKLSRVILAIISFVVLFIIFKIEASSLTILSIVFSFIIYIASFFSTSVSKFFINTGNKINNKIVKILYYIVLPIILNYIFIKIYIFELAISETYPSQKELGAALSQAFWFLFQIVVIFILVFVPYVQTLIVLLLMKIEKIKLKSIQNN